MPFEGEIGNEYSVLITEMAHDGVSLVGHNKYYDQVLIKGNVDNLMGTRVRVRITQVTKHSMIGEVISDPVNPAISVNEQLEREKKEKDCKVETNSVKGYLPFVIGGALLAYLVYRRIR